MIAARAAADPRRRAARRRRQPARAADALAGPAGEDYAAIPSVWRAYLLELLTRYRLALGDRAEAPSAPPPRRAGQRRRRRPAICRPRWRTARGRASPWTPATPTTAAERALAVGGARRRRSARPIEAALARTIAGRALAQLGQRERAVRRAPAGGRASSTACGAVRYRDAAERELRQLGQHIHRRTRARRPRQTGVGSLTERELEIARLIVDRKTNAEIAGELFLSKKTVETHIRNIFRKLDAGSRVEIARAVERAERVTD